MFRHIKHAAAAAVCAAALPAAAGNLVDIDIVQRTTGGIAQTWQHDGRTFVAGQPGERYAVRITNRTGARILAVVSVDGVNVVTGETAGAQQNGYVLGPWQSYDIPGWRKNTNEVAQFYFTSLGDSYAARTGRPANVGVIGVAAFREWQAPRPQPLQPQPFSPRGDASGGQTSDAAGGAAAAAEAQDRVASSRAAEAEAAPQRRERIGTGHGEREQSRVTLVDFRRATAHPQETLAIHYDSFANLVARGVIAPPPLAGHGNPFPASMRFVADPPR